MPREDLALYLTLAPEFGGTRFGPYEGLEVRLGTDRERCHIVLAEGLGVVRDHCKVLRAGPDSLILTPAERTAAVWLWKAGAIRATQVQTPTAVRPGDAFSLVTPQGPRFVIELAPLPESIKAERATTGKRSLRRLTPAKFMAEVWRLFIARLYTFSPISLGARIWYFIQSGAIWQPRILITLFLSGMTFMTMLMGSCHIMSLRNQITSVTSDNEALRATVATCEDLEGKRTETYDLTDLAYRLSGSPHLKKVLYNDGLLKQKVEERARFIADNRERYEWLYKNPTVVSSFKRWRERIVDNDQAKAAIDPVTRNLLAFAAAVPNRIDRDWSNVVDSSGEGACVRGPMALTYRQAVNLGLANVQPDAFWQGDATEYSTKPEARMTLLNAATVKARAPALLETASTAAYAISQGERTCVYAEGADDRDDVGEVARMLAKQVGKGAPGLPSPDYDTAEVARIAKLYAADLPGVSFAGSDPPISFTKSTPSAALKDIAGGDWVIDQVAEVLARSLVLPCDALLNGDAAEMEKVFGTLPDAIPCLVLFYRLDHPK